MQASKRALQVSMGLFTAHVIVAAASLKTGPWPLTSHLIQLSMGIVTVLVSLEAARRSQGLAREFWWFASAGYMLWCAGQTLDTYLGLILKLPFEQRWGIDVFYYAWPASLVICLTLSADGEEKGWIWERILDFAQAGILLVMLYAYFLSDVPLHGRSPGVWKLSLATDGLIAGAFFARAALSGADPTKDLFRRVGYFRLVAALTDLYFVLGLSDGIRTNWFDPVWSGQWLFAIYAATAWDGTRESPKERISVINLPIVRQAPAGQFLLVTFPLLMIVLAAEMAKGQFVLAAIAVTLSLSIAYGRLIMSRRQEQRSIEERNQAITALGENEERFRTLFEGSPIGIAVLDVQGREVTSNDAYRALVGVKPEEEMNVDLLMELTTPETREEDRAMFQEIATGARHQARREKTYQRRDGKRVWADLSLFAQRNFSGKPRVVTCMAIDITEKKNLEQQLRQAQRIETIGRLAGGVAHDFNNLLTVIKGYCDVAMDDPGTDATLRPRLERISQAADKAGALTHQLLAFSRQQILQPKVFQLKDLVCESGKMLERLIGEDIEMRMITASESGTVKADPGQIEQVILNLVINARDAMADGGKLTVETANAELTEEFCRKHQGAQAGPYVMLAVSDTGTGMDEETIAHIFEPFYTTKELGKGTGLGLSMVYGIVKQSNGYILVESAVGKGTTFRVYLPRVLEERVEAGRERSMGRNGDGRETILVVEDDAAVRELTREVLASRGYCVMVACCPEEALKLCGRQTGPIDLLITDAVMPGMSGREMARKVAEARPGISILMMSGYTDPRHAQIKVADHTAVFLQKPFTPGSLTQLVRRILDERRQSTRA